MSRQDTILASDPIWTKSESPCVSGIPTPSPPLNEPSIYITPIGDDIDSLTPHLALRSLSQTLQLAEVDKVDIDVPTSVTPESSHQVGIFSALLTFIFPLMCFARFAVGWIVPSGYPSC